MNCIIPGLNVKVLARALQALAKIGDELFIEAKSEKFTLLTFNQSKTVCGQFHFLESFFSVYSVKEKEFNENSAIGCKIHMKTLLPLFKGTNLEKKLDFIKIEYASLSDSIHFKVKYKADDITMIHILRLLDPEISTIDDYSGIQTNSISAPSNFYNNLLSLFSNSDDDISFDVTKNKLVARNYCAGSPHKPKSVRSQVNLRSSEFSLFRISEETTINFPLKPFRTAISFADAFNINIGIDFDKGGRPLSISMKNPTFEVIFIVATVNPYMEGQSTIATTSLGAKVSQVQMNGIQNNITHEDLVALTNENWEDFEAEMDHEMRKNPDRDKNHSNIMPTKDNSLSWLEDKKCASKGPKKFVLEEEDENNFVDSNMDVVQRSPESPKTKKARLIFKRSYDVTFHPINKRIFAKDSDSE
ncbi:cell cycle checkpoint control protein RAD9A [Anthonomus grandis grandis]|uniref:cell cycle checkpoint control protein RAD9A n=1 Tax=Anthonomus grandis grandis TaxID=2921223 RepID=UPI002165DD6B|nr:cell cycle checkpoint control protein RAD9A [Anthonomus grandis grandis]